MTIILPGFFYLTTFALCSYNKDLLDKVMEMADGIEVEDLPQFTTRGEFMKKVNRISKCI